MKTYAIAFASLLALSGAAFAQGTPETGTVIVTISGVQPNKGMVSVGICDTGLGGDNCPVSGKQHSAAETLEFIFENIPAGHYAFGGHQDLNENGERDSNLLGIPKEPVALSNNALQKMMPSFADAKLPVAAGVETRVDLRLQMFGAKNASAAR